MAFTRLTLPAGAEVVKRPHIQAELVSESSTLVPGKTILMALRLHPEEHWHTYWRTPGESGSATTVKWTVPAGYKVSEIRWPLPQIIDSGGIISYGYSGETLHLVEVSVPANAKPGQNVKLAGDAQWVVCSDGCTMGKATVALSLPVASSAKPTPWAARLQDAEAHRPGPLAGASARRSADQIDLSVPGHPSAKSARFYPYQDLVIEDSPPQAWQSGTLSIKAAKTPKPAARLCGLLVLEEDGKSVGYEINVPIQK